MNDPDHAYDWRLSLLDVSAAFAAERFLWFALRTPFTDFGLQSLLISAVLLVLLGYGTTVYADLRFGVNRGRVTDYLPFST